jgi:hypothetical protein
MTKAPGGHKELGGPVHEDTPNAVGGGRLDCPFLRPDLSLANPARMATAAGLKDRQRESVRRNGRGGGPRSQAAHSGRTRKMFGLVLVSRAFAWRVLHAFCVKFAPAGPSPVGKQARTALARFLLTKQDSVMKRGDAICAFPVDLRPHSEISGPGRHGWLFCPPLSRGSLCSSKGVLINARTTIEVL